MWYYEVDQQSARLKTYYGARLVQTSTNSGAALAAVREAKTNKLIGSNWVGWGDTGYITVWLSTDALSGPGHTMNTGADVDAFIAANP